MTSIRLVQDDRNYLDIVVLARSLPAAQDAWDGNLLDVRVEYLTRGSGDSYRTRLFTMDLEAFRAELSGEAVDDSGIIALKTIDGVVSVEVERDRDQYVAHCNLCRLPDGYDATSFTLGLTPGAVSRSLIQLEAVMREFPVRGRHRRARVHSAPWLN